MPSFPRPDSKRPSSASAFLDGVRAACMSVFSLVLVGSYVGIGALAHDFGFSLPWVMASTVLVWAAPAQVILVSALGAGAALVEVAIAIGLSAVRLMPMVVALLPLLKQPSTPTRALILPAHFTAISMWIESLRLLPAVPRERRIAFCNGIGVTFMCAAHVGSVIGFYLAGQLPAGLTAGLLFLTPMSFLVSTIRNSRVTVDRLALAFGLVIAPLLAWWQIGLDLMWTGIIGGSAAYGIHRLREAMR
jgi:predicted branched-subunit amino acid permease